MPDTVHDEYHSEAVLYCFCKYLEAAFHFYISSDLSRSGEGILVDVHIMQPNLFRTSHCPYSFHRQSLVRFIRTAFETVNSCDHWEIENEAIFKAHG